MQTSRIPMDCLILAFGLSILCLTNNAKSEDAERPEVTILQGRLRGKTLETNHGRSISAFLGIPYAQPPTGNLRFANPVPAHGWNGTRNASRDANICPQVGRAVSGDEDCLYLNVYTPKLAHNSSSPLIAVMVYIHGGAFMYGSSSSLSRGPGHILDKDVILVSMNYRLGPLGFLSTGDEVASGNWGLKDQVLALKWVQANIEYFGGDPDKVTIFGESAGGASVHLLTLSNSTIGLFRSYITESGSALGIWAHRPRRAYARRAFELGQFVGCAHLTTEYLINCLRKIDFSVIMSTKSQFLIWNKFPEIVFGPTDEPDIEGALLTDTPKNLFAKGQVRDLPWMSGVVRDEGLLMTRGFYGNDELFDEFLEKFDIVLPLMLSNTFLPDRGVAWIDAIKSYYFNNDLTANKSLLLANLTILISDSQFFYPAYTGLRQQLGLALSPLFFYTFDYRSTFNLNTLFSDSTLDVGVAHGAELKYLFTRNSDPPLNSNERLIKDNEIVEIMVKLWTSFAIDGIPTLSPLNNATTWDPYSAADNHLRIGNDTNVVVEMRHPFFEERMKFWTDLYDTIHYDQ